MRPLLPPMKIAVYSDLHLEFARFTPPADLEADVVVLAGDIHAPGRKVALWAGKQPAFRHKEVIHVAGNHEFYRAEYQDERARMAEEAQRAGVHYLDASGFMYAGVRFLGCTLWTDFRLRISESGQSRSDPERAMAECQRFLMDYQAIVLAEHAPDHQPNYRSLAPPDTLSMHMQERAWLESALVEPHDGPTVVVTHHAPHRGSLSARFQDDWLSGGFVNELPDELFDVPCLWIHGHTHARFDYRVRNCRIVCNPRGYLQAGGGFEAEFDPRFVIEI